MYSNYINHVFNYIAEYCRLRNRSQERNCQNQIMSLQIDLKPREREM